MVACSLRSVYTVSPSTTKSTAPEANKTRMGKNSPLHTKSAQLKKALVWMAEILQEHPEKQRLVILREAELRFDLTPKECAFLDNHFSSS